MSRWSNMVPPQQYVIKCRSACVNSGDVCDVYHVCQSLHIPSDMLVFCLCGIHCTVWCSYIRSLCLANWWLGWWPWYKQAQPCYKQIVRSANLRQTWLGEDWGVPQVLHRLQNKEKPIRTTFTLRFGSLKMIFECSIARCDVGLGRAIVQCQKNPLRKPKLSINRAILSAHFSAVKFCIGFFCWIGFFWFCIGFFCNWMLQLLLKIVAKNLNYASLHVCT